MKWKVDKWMLDHDWPTRYPRTYLFWDWVIPPNGGMGFMRWLQWVFRDALGGEHD